MNLCEHTLKELLPFSLFSTPCVSIQKESKVWNGAAMLIHYLESFTDSLVVTDQNEPIGIVGGREVIEGVLNTPTSEFFDSKFIKDIMDTNLVQISENNTLNNLLDEWTETKRGFSMIPNQYGGYSAVSVRRILEIGITCKTKMMISDLPKKKVISFKKDDPIREVINSMLENQTRKLVLENSNKFISDRIIIEKIARDLNYLREVDDFLSIPASSFFFAEAKILDEDIPIQKAYEIMFGMLHPYLIFKDQVISPWDLCKNLKSDKIQI